MTGVQTCALPISMEFQPDGSSILFEPPVGTPLYKTIAEFPYNDIPANLTNVKKGVILFDMLQFLYQNSFKDLDPKLYVQFKNEKQFKFSISYLKIMVFFND